MYHSKLFVVELESGEYHTFVRGSIAGNAVRIVVDTGASHTCMDAAYAQTMLPQLQAVVHDGVKAGIGGADFEVRVADIPDFRIGHFHLDHYENIALIDFSYINMAYERLNRKPVQMILGNDFLVRHQAEINYKQKMLVFEK